MNVVLAALLGALNLLGAILLNPGTIVLALVVVVLAVMTFLVKNAFFIKLWADISTMVNNAWAWAVKYPWVFVALGIFYFFDQSLFGFAVLIMVGIVLALERLGVIK